MARQYDVIDLEKRLSFALGLLPELSVLTLKDFGATAGKQIKADGSLVTSADQFIESWLRRSIEASFQDDGILGEELGETASRSGYTWTIDPIDGTDSFVKGVPLFGNMIGIKLGDGTPVLGVVQLPALGEALYAIRGQGAFWRPRLSEPFKPCHALSKTIVGSVTVCYSDESYFAFHKVVPFLNELRSKNWTLRTWAMAAGCRKDVAVFCDSTSNQMKSHENLASRVAKPF